MTYVHRVHHPWAPRLGRVYYMDPASKAYALPAVTAPGPPRTTPWALGPTLDQGNTPECVPFTGRELLSAEPALDPDQSSPTPAQLYPLCQANDGIPQPHDGSNSHGLMKAFQSLNLIDSYHWAQNPDEAFAYLQTTGPLACGSDWTQGMFSPDANGFISPVGPIEGGHEYLAYFYSSAEDAVWFQQSWGPAWDPAFPGRFKMKTADVRTLFAQGMDFCAAQIHFPRPTIAPPPPPSRHHWWDFWPWT